MNKKIVFTISSVLLVCATLFMACEKSSTTSSSSSATSTSGGTTGGTTGVAGTLNIDGAAHSVLTGTTVVGSTYVLVSNQNSSYPSLSLNFAGTSAPAAGTYTASSNYPTSGNCGAVLTPTISVTWTVVTCNMTVTAGSSKNVTFTNATFTDGTSTHTVTANLPF